MTLTLLGGGSESQGTAGTIGTGFRGEGTMLSEIGGGGSGPPAGGDRFPGPSPGSFNVNKRKYNDGEVNPKLKQCFEKKTEIKPFYSGGKIAILSDCHFACQCGSAINVISTLKKEVPPEEDASVNGDDGGSDKTTECFQIISHLETELDEIIAFDACPSSHILVTSHKSTLVRVWDLDKNEVIKTVKSLHHLPIGLIEIHKTRARDSRQNQQQGTAAGFPGNDDEDIVELQVPSYDEATISTRNDLLWATISSSIVRIWEFGGNQMSKAIPIGEITALGYARWHDENTKTLFVAERNIYVIESVTSGKEAQYKVTHKLEGHYSQVTGIEFAKDGKMMVSGGRDKVLILWEIDKAKNTYSQLKAVPFPEPIESIVLTSPTDIYVTLSSSDIRHYDIAKNRFATSTVLTQGVDEPIVALFAPMKSQEDSSRDYFYAATHSSVMFRLEPNKQKLLKVTRQYVGCLDEILCVVFWGSPDKIAVANNTNVIKVYTLSTGQCEFLRGHKDIVLTLDTHKDWLVSGSKDNNVMLWTSDSNKPQTILEGHLASVTAVCFNPLNPVMYSVSEDYFLKSWNRKESSSSSRSIKSQLAHDKEIHSVSCSANGSLLITSSRDKTAKVWDAESLELVSTLKGHKKSVWDARFSAWDQLAATSSADTTIKIWNLVSFSCIQTLQGHLSSVLQVMFGNLGLQVVSTSSDGTMRVWDLKTSLCISTEECSNDKLWTVAAQDDLSLIVTGSADSIITVWTDITEEKVKEGQAKRKRFLEDEQKLNNVMRSGQWQEAFKLAIELERPYTVLRIIRELQEPIQELSPIVKGLTQDLKAQLLVYIKQWNSNTKTCTEAQYLLNTILKTSPIQNLSEDLPTEALIAYTQKHYNRLRSHRERMSVIQYFANKEDIIS